MKKLVTAVLAVILILSLAACASGRENSITDQSAAYSYTEYPLARNGIDLHLDCMQVEGTQPDKNILLIHGVTYPFRARNRTKL